jgi:endogenous inhibitor of DNA gyrase (YacG/DUF329 family)
MNENTQKVVKCISCDKYFGHGEDNKNCPFCNTEYTEVEEKPKESKDLHATVQTGHAGRKVPVKTQKESF